MKNKKYTFVEFIAAQESDDFDNIDPKWLEWAKKFVSGMGDMGDLVHNGDCTKQAISCLLCVYEQMLSSYHDYFFGVFNPGDDEE